MSVVTGIVVCMSCGEPEEKEDGFPVAIAKINAWIKEQLGTDCTLEMVERHAGGSKHPQMYVACGGFNYFRNGEFLEFFKTLEWEYPENVVLILEPEEGVTIVWRPGSI